MLESFFLHKIMILMIIIKRSIVLLFREQLKGSFPRHDLEFDST